MATGIRLTVPPQYRDRFEFIFHIEQSPDGQTAVCRAEIVEYSVLKAVVQVVDRKRTRLELADMVLERCLQWMDIRLRSGDR